MTMLEGRRDTRRTAPATGVNGPPPLGSLPARPAAFMFDVYGTLLMPLPTDIGADRGATPPWRALAVLLDQYSVRCTAEALCRDLREEIAAVHARMKTRGIDYPEVEIDRIWQSVLGTGDRDFARQFALDFEMTVNPVYPLPDAAAVLSAIRKRKIPAGIISNAQFYTGHLLKRFFGDLPQDSWADPELIFYSFEHGRAKPSAYLFQQAAAALSRKDISARDTLYVGNDPIKDIGPAAGAGFRTALFAGDAGSLRLSEANNRECRPDLVITALRQLEPWIG